MSDSKTPRTDEHFYGRYLIQKLDEDFMHQLETELATAQACIKELEKDKKRLDWLLLGKTIKGKDWVVQPFNYKGREQIDEAMQEGKR
jgi:hypothetical protein